MVKAHRAQHSIQLAVSQLVVTEAFYAGILELPVQRSFSAVGAPDHLVVDMDGIALMFVEENGRGADPVRCWSIASACFPRGSA